jgi:hypothetical protein
MVRYQKVTNNKKTVESSQSLCLKGRYFPQCLSPIQPKTTPTHNLKHIFQQPFFPARQTHFPAFLRLPRVQPSQFPSSGGPLTFRCEDVSRECMDLTLFLN